MVPLTKNSLARTRCTKDNRPAPGRSNDAAAARARPAPTTNDGSRQWLRGGGGPTVPNAGVPTAPRGGRRRKIHALPRAVTSSCIIGLLNECSQLIHSSWRSNNTPTPSRPTNTRKTTTNDVKAACTKNTNNVSRDKLPMPPMPT